MTGLTAGELEGLAYVKENSFLNSFISEFMKIFHVYLKLH